MTYARFRTPQALEGRRDPLRWIGSYALLCAASDLLRTGPTGTIVADVVCVLIRA